jgi:hypothetical protein
VLQSYSDATVPLCALSVATVEVPLSIHKFLDCSTNAITLQL